MTPQNLLIRMSDQHKARMMGCAGHPLAKDFESGCAGGAWDALCRRLTLPSRRFKCLAPDKTTSTCPGGEDWRKRSILL